jgi:Zn ribbon nucleic-acid-binding protein
MKVNQQKLIEEFGLRSFGARGWKHSRHLPCPQCQGNDKFGILFTEDGSGIVHCFKCDYKTSLKAFLFKINRSDLIVGEQEDFSFKDKLDVFLTDFNVEEQELTCPSIPLPLGFRFLKTDEYLQNRGWELWQIEKYCAGTSIDPRMKNKIVFLLKEDGKTIGYLSRSKYSKDWHKKNLQDSKQGKCRFVTRYENSTATEFEKVVGGVDEIVPGETTTVLLVEGIMDKANTDKVLGLQNQTEIKCCFTFGCKLSEYQMLKIYKRGIEKVILLYDPGTIQQVKSSSLKLMKYFDIFVGELLGEKDPGEMEFSDFEKVFAKLVSPLEYYANRIQKVELKF